MCSSIHPIAIKVSGVVVSTPTYVCGVFVSFSGTETRRIHLVNNKTKCEMGLWLGFRGQRRTLLSQTFCFRL